MSRKLPFTSPCTVFKNHRIVIYPNCKFRKESAIIEKCIFHQEILIITIPGFKEKLLGRDIMSGHFLLWKVLSTRRRGPHLCPCSPTLPRNKLVERTSGVSGPSYLLSMSTRLFHLLGSRYHSPYSIQIVAYIEKIYEHRILNQEYG
jgi:hypothetical protein